MNEIMNKNQSLIYCIYPMDNLGCFPHCVVVDTDKDGNFSTQYVRLNEHNKSNYIHLFDGTDELLFQYCMKLEKNNIVSKINDRKIRDWEDVEKAYFRSKNLTKEAQYIKTYLLGYIEINQRKFFENTGEKILCLQVGRFPFSWPKLRFEEELADLSYCFENEPNGINYTLDIRCKNKTLSLTDAILVSRKPARILLKNKIFEFEDEIEGQKLIPFFNKKSLNIPAHSKAEYIQKVILPVIPGNKVINKGFDIQIFTEISTTLLRVREIQPITQTSLFDDKKTTDLTQNNIVFELIFEYTKFLYRAGQNSTTTKIEMNNDTFTIYKAERDLNAESVYINAMKELGADLNAKVMTLPFNDGIEWLNRNYKSIEASGIDIKFEKKTGEQQALFSGERTLTLMFDEDKDWFNIRAKVMFGKYEIPFIRILNYIRQDKHQLTLPGGEYVIIPQAWFDEYKTLIDFCKTEDGKIVVAKHHCVLMNAFSNKSDIKISIKQNMNSLLSHDLKTSFDLPVNFNGILRHYQQEGYNWLRLLDELALGGCLADDMGLGKTIQTLFLLQWMKEQNRGISLLVVPTSLIYNWEQEAAKFTPQLRVHVHTGKQRSVQPEEFKDADILLTSYGVLRRDKHLLTGIQFNYAILDEAQAIKNPQSDTAQVCLTLKAKRFLTLTGTPIENSLSDLWSQVHFFNRNMLGNLNNFVRACKQPHKQELYRQLLKPFLLRRNKSEVITELPEKTIITQYCDMTEGQKIFYRNLRNSYRDKFLETREPDNKINPMLLLEGLLRLRQAANHPLLNDPDFADESGKFELVCQMLDELIARDSKVLIFSSFVEHLNLYKNYLEENNIQFSYLVGNTKDRKGEVERFQNNPDTKVFLLSLKAGGVGLNLTSAGYVFLLDPWWNPAAEAQAYDRAHRIGQKNKVFVYKFISRNTIEEKIIQLQEEKNRLFNSMINPDNELLKNLNINEVMQLLGD